MSIRSPCAVREQSVRASTDESEGVHQSEGIHLLMNPRASIHSPTIFSYQEMAELFPSGQRFRRVSRPCATTSLELDPLLSENLEQWPHLNELVQCYKADWVRDEGKYGHYDSVPSASFQNQIFEGPDTDIETEIRLSNIRHRRNGEATDDEDPSTSGRHSHDSISSEHMYSKYTDKHFGASPLPAYKPVFDWENERSYIFGQRTPEVPPTLCGSELKISVKVLSLTFQAGFVEPFCGTICLYHRERREKLSEDYFFQFLPNEMQDGKITLQRHAIFSLDFPSSSICLLIQLDKPATEEGGVAPSVYSRKEPVHLTEREKQKPLRAPVKYGYVPNWPQLNEEVPCTAAKELMEYEK